MRLLRCHTGVAVIEFAFLLPIFIVLLIGTVELARFALVNQKLDKTATTMADFLTQRSVARFSEMDGFANSAVQIVRPFTFDNGSVIFSAVTFRDTGTPPCAGINVSCISWQYRPTGTGNSRLGAIGGNAAFPGGYSVLPGQLAIVAEVTMDYSPMLSITGTIVPALSPQTIYKIAIFKPRQTGSLVNPPT